MESLLQELRGQRRIAEGQINIEELADNVSKQEFWKGRFAGLTYAIAAMEDYRKNNP